MTEFTPNVFRFFQEKLMRSRKSTHADTHDDVHAVCSEREIEFRMKNRRHANDALTSALSAFYAKLIIVVGIAFPIVDVLTPNRIKEVYKGFYFYLYIGSIAFVAFMHIDRSIRSRRLLAAQTNEGQKNPEQKQSTLLKCSFSFLQTKNRSTNYWHR